MCLFIKENQQCEIAKRDITCYKYVLVDGDRIVTPCERVEVPATCFSVGKPFEPEYIPPCTSLERDIEDGIIAGGFIHTFKWRFFLPSMKSDARARLYKCIIPKGTSYFEGQDGSKRGSYASREIIFKRRIR